MSVPGSNILAQAFRVIRPQPVKYFKWTGRTVNDIGLDVATYADPITLNGSVQAVGRNVYEQLGLDWQKNYINFYIKQRATDINRNQSGDQLEFCGRRYEAKSEANWFGIDGWVYILCVDIGPATIPVTLYVPPIPGIGYGSRYGIYA